MLNLFQYLIFPLSLSLPAVDVHIYFVFFPVLLLCQEAAGLRRKVMIIDPVAASPRGTERGECFIFEVWPATRKHSLSILLLFFPSFSSRLSLFSSSYFSLFLPSFLSISSLILSPVLTDYYLFFPNSYFVSPHLQSHVTSFISSLSEVSRSVLFLSGFYCFSFICLLFLYPFPSQNWGAPVSTWTA